MKIGFGRLRWTDPLGPVRAARRGTARGRLVSNRSLAGRTPGASAAPALLPTGPGLWPDRLGAYGGSSGG